LGGQDTPPEDSAPVADRDGHRAGASGLRRPAVRSLAHSRGCAGREWVRQSNDPRSLSRTGGACASLLGSGSGVERGVTAEPGSWLPPPRRRVSFLLGNETESRMGHSTTLYAVDLDRLTSAVGSGILA